MSLVQMSLSGGAFVLFIVVVRALALHRLPKRMFAVLWVLAALRLLLPCSIPLPQGVKIPVVSVPVGGGAVPDTTAMSTGGTASGAWAVPMGAAVPANTGFGGVAAMVWLAGVALMGVYFGALYVWTWRRLRSSVRDDAPAVRRFLAEQTLRRPLRVRQSPLVTSALTYGILRPVIVLPEDMERDDEAALTYVLTHELIHIRRFDAVAKLVFAAALCVHWFNPLAWVLYVLANRDLELSCDEAVLNTLGGKEKMFYALTLINMEESRSRGLPLYSHFSKLAIEERIEAIMKYKKRTFMTAFLAAVLVMGATTAFATSVETDKALSPGRQSSSVNVEKIENESTILSYVNPNDGQTYYSWDGGKTFEPMTDEEYEQHFQQHNVQWWSYEEYAAWLENEKVQLQGMLGEKGWTGGRGEFVWTQEIIDETIAMYEHILQDIKEGMLYSKSVDGSDDCMISGNPDSGAIIASKKLVVGADGKYTVVPKESQGNIGNFQDQNLQIIGGDDVNYQVIPKDQLRWDEDALALAPGHSEEEMEQIIADIESGKIQPFEIPEDTYSTFRFVKIPKEN